MGREQVVQRPGIWRDYGTVELMEEGWAALAGRVVRGDEQRPVWLLGFTRRYMEYVAPEK